MLPLIRLLIDNKGKPGRFEAVQNSAQETTVYLYDMIVSSDQQAMYGGGVSPESFAKTLTAIKTPVINLRINSPGGDVFAGRAMEAAIREHPSTVIAHVDGYAASAASIVALAADQVQISDGAFFMIHNAWTVIGGNAVEFVKAADLLGKVDSTLIETYAKKTGADPLQIAAWMAAETWFTAKESVAAGLATKITEYAPKNTAGWNMSAYSGAPVIETKAEEAPEIIDHGEQRMRALALLMAA